MSRAQVIYLHLSAALTAITGIAFAYMKYALTSDDPFSVVNHPMQPHALSTHVVVAPLLVFTLGWIFGDHIWPKYLQRNAPYRRSGLWSMAMIAPMTLSGYLIQVTTTESVRQAMTIVHWVSSALFVLAYGIHLMTKKERMAARRPED